MGFHPQSGTPWVKHLRSLLLEEKQTWVCWEVNRVLCQELVCLTPNIRWGFVSLYPVYLSLYKVFEVKFRSQLSSQGLWEPKSLSSQRHWGFSEKLPPLPIFTVPGLILHSWVQKGGDLKIPSVLLLNCRKWGVGAVEQQSDNLYINGQIHR